MPRQMTAVFHRPAHAEAFYARLSQPGWFVQPGSLRLDDMTVVWRTDGREDAEPDGPSIQIMDMRQTVGSFGSPPDGPMATLNGHPCRGGA